MTTRHLYGMTYEGYEVTLPINHAPKALTKGIRAILEEDPRSILHSVSSAPDPYDETSVLYSIVVAR